MIKTLLWNEWRQKRFIFISMAILFGTIWLLIWLTSALASDRQIRKGCEDIIMLLIMISLYIIPFMSLYDPNTWNRKQNNVNPFLFGMPVSPGKIFWTKFFVGQAFIAFFCGGNLALIYLWEMVWGLDQTIKTLPLATLPIMIFPFYWIFFGISQTSPKKDKSLGLSFIALVYSVVTVTIVFYVFLSELLQSRWYSFCISFYIVITLVSLYGLFRLWHIWEIGIFRDMPINKLVMKESLRLFLISTTLFVIAWGYAKINYEYARTQAIEAGIIPATYDKKIQTNQNGAQYLIMFNERWEPTWDKITKTEGHCNLLNKWKTPLSDTQKEIIKELESPRMLNADRYLHQAMKAPHIQITPTSQNEWSNGWNEFINAVRFLEIKAICAKYKNNRKELFSAINDIIKLSEIIPGATPDVSSGIFYSRACWFAFLLGPDTKKTTDYYQKLLDQTENVNLFSIEYQWGTLDIMIATKIPWKILPIYLQNQSQMLRQHIAEKKLIMQATNGLPSVYKRAKAIFTPTFTRDKFGISTIYQYFRYQSDLNIKRIALALKIYRIERGNYPDTLDKLSPGIFKQVPIDTLNGTPFQYQRTKDGFTISGGKDLKITYPPDTSREES